MSFSKVLPELLLGGFMVGTITPGLLNKNTKSVLLGSNGFQVFPRDNAESLNRCTND